MSLPPNILLYGQMAFWMAALILGTAEFRRTRAMGQDGFLWAALLLLLAPYAIVAQAMREDVWLATSKVVVATNLAAFTLVALVVISRIAAAAERRLHRLDRPHTAMILGRMVRLFGLLPLLLLIAREAQWDLTALLATAGVVGVAVGFAAQTSLSNVIAGVFLLFDRPFSIGDMVEIDGQQGMIESITLMSTHMRTFDNLLVRWPNEVVLSARIHNYARYATRRVDILVRVPIDTDVEQVRRVLVAGLQDEATLLIEPTPDVRFRDLDNNGISILVRAWAPIDGFLAARDATVLCILRELRAIGVMPMVANIELPALPTYAGAQEDSREH